MRVPIITILGLLSLSTCASPYPSPAQSAAMDAQAAREVAHVFCGEDTPENQLALKSCFRAHPGIETAYYSNPPPVPQSHLTIDQMEQAWAEGDARRWHERVAHDLTILESREHLTW